METRQVLEVIILDPEVQKATVPAKLRQINPDLRRCEYVPNKIGLRSVNVQMACVDGTTYACKYVP